MFAVGVVGSVRWSRASNSLVDMATLALRTSSGAQGAPSVLVNSVRYRWHKDKPMIPSRGYGYKDKLDWRGPLPRIPTGMPLPQPPYYPTKSWAEKKALFGQNDYIDILGDNENLRPIQLQAHIPAWLRGFSGNEYQMLLRKRALFGRKIKAGRPMEWHNLKKRIKYLYRTLNYNTKNFMDRKVLRR